MSGAAPLRAGVSAGPAILPRLCAARVIVTADGGTRGTSYAPLTVALGCRTSVARSPRSGMRGACSVASANASASIQGEAMSVDQRVMKATTLLAFLAVGAILYFAAVAFIPVVLALFFALLLSPAVDALQRMRVPRTAAAAIVMLAIILAGAAVVDAISAPAKEWFARAPQTIHKIELRIRPVRAVIAQVDAVTERAGQLAQGPHAPACAAAARKLRRLLCLRNDAIVAGVIDDHTAHPFLLGGWAATAGANGRLPCRQPALRGRVCASRRPYGPSSAAITARLH